MASVQLTAGICQRLHNASTEEEQDILFNSNPTLQVLSLKKVGPQTTNAIDRYRIILSDGEHFVQAMLATQLNTQIDDGTIAKHSVVVVEKFTSNLVQEKRLLIVLGMHHVAHLNEKIGAPVALSNPGSDGAGNTPAVQGAHAPAAAAPATTSRQVQQQRQQTRSGRSIFPIEALSPYQNNWTIRARVTHKGDIRSWSNQRGEGKLFSVTFMDDSGEIRGTAFNQAVEDLYDKLHEGKVYFISKARVNLAKKKFSNLANEYELGLEKNTEIEECTDTANLPVVKYNFVLLNDLTSLEGGATCDVIGIVQETGDLGEIVAKATNKTLTKRELTIVDRSNFSVRLTLWGKQAEQYQESGNPVIAWKSVKVSDFGGRSLGMISSSTMNVNPDIPEAHALRGWYDAGGNSETFQSHSSGSFSSGPVVFNHDELRQISDIKDDNLGFGDKPDTFNCRGTIMHIKSENIAYPACQSVGCNKKVVQGNDDKWRCEKCEKDWDRPKYRYILSMAVSDHSGQQWFSGFNDVGETLFQQKTADELINLKEESDSEYQQVLDSAVGHAYNFTLKIKSEAYGDNNRVRCSIVKIQPLDFKQEGHYLKKLLSSEWAQ